MPATLPPSADQVFLDPNYQGIESILRQQSRVEENGFKLYNWKTQDENNNVEFLVITILIVVILSFVVCSIIWLEVACKSQNVLWS